VERVAELNRDFDLVISTGVLHHLADPEAGMASLAAVLRPEGVLAVMLYATYGRVGVQMLQSVFRDLGLGQDEDSIRVVREVLTHIDARYALEEVMVKLLIGLVQVPVI
jgi:SAM-dependent methyltransferase